MAAEAAGGGGAPTGAPLDAPSASSARPVMRRHVSSRPSGPDERAVRREQVCRQCGHQISGQFVRALGSVYHLECFRCADCGCNVASKFFSATDDMMHENPGQLFPLCETDYFRRLDLLCAKCGRALRGSYITALGAKYHVEHFTCSLCETQFGPDDSYYEHGGQVYCHFHYSTLFAIQCAGCQTAILKQFVEINRNNADEHWHPECYMIHRYWKIKLAPQIHAPPTRLRDRADEVALSMPGALALSPSSSDDGAEEAPAETPASVLQKQRAMEHRVFTIWRVLSTFEESSAACISDMLRHVSSGKYLGGVRFAVRFVVHVEVLFSAIDELDMHFQRAGAPSIQYVREARMLCKKIVNFFSLLSHSQETGEERMHITQELLSLVTGLAHYLKILIRIALTGALRLDQEHGVPAALESFLARLDELLSLQGLHDTLDTDAVHGYTSLPCVRGPHEADQAADLCVLCGHTVEDECVRLSIELRWHWACVQCAKCQRGAVKPDGSVPLRRGADDAAARPPSVPITQFVYHSARRDKGAMQCVGCAGEPAARYLPVTRLEQYAFLLCVALKRLDALLKRQALLEAPLPPEPEPDALTDAESSTYRKSAEAKRIESQYLDRHMSSKAHVPRISTVIGQPAGFHTAPGGESVRHEAAPHARPTAGAIPIRAPFARHNLDVLVREDDARTPPLPSDSANEGITLADIPMILQAEHDREQRVSGEAARRPVSSLSSEELLVLKYVALVRLQQSVLGDQLRMDELLELLEVRKSTFWGKLLFKGGKDRRDVRRKGVFGVSLEYLVERQGADSTLGATPTPMRVPALVDDIVSAMRQMDVSVEGIFRKNGHVRRLKELADALDRDADGVNLFEDHPVQLAALLKKFLRELPDPLLTTRLYSLFLAAQVSEGDAAERHRLLRLVAMLLPRAHRDTMEVLFVFFKFVATFSYVDDETGSRMDAANLATVLAPSLLFTRAAEPTPTEAHIAQRVVCDMIEHQDDFWFVSEDLERALRDRALVSAAPELAPTEMLRLCAAYA